MSKGTVRLHRVLRAKPERVYRAFLDAAAMAKWLPPCGFTCTVHHMDAKVGGTYRMSFTNFTTGHAHSFGGEYRELVPFERIRYTDSFEDPNLPGEMQTTVSMKQVSCGTELNIVQEGLPEVIPLEMCYLGWQESLAQLANLVEPEIRIKEVTPSCHRPTLPRCAPSAAHRRVPPGAASGVAVTNETQRNVVSRIAEIFHRHFSSGDHLPVPIYMLWIHASTAFEKNGSGGLRDPLTLYVASVVAEVLLPSLRGKGGPGRRISWVGLTCRDGRVLPIALI
jgi:uncharacterized protein YndB with AHSA1/START domain